MPKEKGVVTFDFDGVIGDTVAENWVQAQKAYREVRGSTVTGRRAEKAFLKARPFLTKVEHFFTIMRLIEQNPRISFGRMTQERFDGECAKDTVKAVEFTKGFYAARGQMKTKSRAEWLALQKMYSKIAKFVAAVQKGNQVFIASNKDRETIEDLLKIYDIKIPGENILSREFSKDKKLQLQEIAKRAGVGVKEVVLVEDAVKQLKDVATLGAKGVLVKWGYSTRRQRKEAKRNRVPIIRKANVVGRYKIWRTQRKARR